MEMQYGASKGLSAGFVYNIKQIMGNNQLLFP